MADGKVVIDTKLNNKGLENGIKSVSGSLGGLTSVAKKLAGAMAAAFSIRAIVSFSKEAIKLGSDLQEVQNVVDVTFRTMSDKVGEFASAAMTTAGLSETMAKRYVGTFGAMAKAFGFTEEQAYSMSTSLAQLSGDVASFYNVSQDEAFTKLKSVFTGETETLKDLGVVMTQAALDQYALRNGINMTTSAMTEKQKVALRYKFVLEQLSTASGDFARTSGSWANQTRLLSLQFEQLKATIGQGLINALTPVLRVINSVLSSLQSLANAFKSFTVALFGDASGGASGGVTGLGDAYNEAAQGAENLAGGIGAVGTAAKKANTQLLKFDEINQLAAPDSGGSGSGGGTAGGGTFDFGIEPGKTTVLEEQTSTMVQNIMRYLEPLKKISFASLSQSLQGLGSEFAKFGDVISEHFEWSWFHVLVPLSTWTIEEFAPASVDLLSSGFSVFSSIIATVSKGLETLFTKLQPVFSFLGNVAITILSNLSKLFGNVANTITQNGDKINGIFANIGDALLSVWGNVLKPVLSTIVDFYNENFESISAIVTSAVDAIIGVLHGLSEFLSGVFSGDWTKAWQGIKDTFSTVWDNMKIIASSAWDVITGIFSGFAGWFKKIFTDAWQGIVNVFSVAGDIFVNIKNGIITAFKAVVNALIKGINTVVSLPFTGLNKVLQKIQDIELLGLQPFGWLSWRAPVPQIPYLAQGAVLPPNKPFMAVVGDQKNGTNVEAPLATIQEALVNALEQSGGQQVNIRFTGDLAQLARVLKPVIETENRRVGVSLARG